MSIKFNEFSNVLMWVVKNLNTYTSKAIGKQKVFQTRHSLLKRKLRGS